MVNQTLLIGLVAYIIFVFLLIAIKDWSLYKFEKKCQLKIRHLQQKERYELLKRLTR